MLSCVRITQPRMHQRRLCSICRRFSVKPNHSPSKPKAWDHLDKECVDFLPWLERKAGVGISSKLYIGQSTHGRSLFASKRIREGECILTVPYNVQIKSDNLLRKVEIMLGNKVREDIKLAIVLLVEQKIGPKSGWAPYISRLPRPGEMHSPIFWSEIELDMIHQSSLYHETVKQKAQLEEDFETIKPEHQGKELHPWSFGPATGFIRSLTHNISVLYYQHIKLSKYLVKQIMNT